MKSSCDGASLEIANWLKFNPRTDSKKPSWFRVDNSMAIGPDFFELEIDTKWLWIVILSLISKANGDRVTWSTSFIEAMTGIKPSRQEQILVILEEKTNLRVTRASVARHSPGNISTSHATDGRTDRHVNTNEEQKNDLVGKADAHPLFLIWNRNCGKLAKAKGMSRDRMRKAEDLWKRNPSTEYWAEIVSSMARSKFCTGGGASGWRASFDFLLKPETHLRVLEGAYSDRNAANGGEQINTTPIRLEDIV